MFFCYDFKKYGTDFTGKSQPWEFINLKSNIVRHIRSKTHVENEALLENINNSEKK